MKNFKTNNYYRKINNNCSSRTLNREAESEGKDTTRVTVSTKILDMIKKSVANEKEDEEFYTLLKAQAPMEEYKVIINSIAMDERKHNKLLRKIYYDLTGEKLPEDTSNTNQTNNKSYLKNLETALFGELSAVERYREIMAAMPTKEMYADLMEILTDELKHANKYNFLIAKALR